MKTKIFILSIVSLMLLFVNTDAQQITSVQKESGSSSVQKGPYFVDKNNDGICDHRQNQQSNFKNRNFVDKNNDGICDNRQADTKTGRGKNFVDANNNGICDHHENGTCCRKGHGMGNGKGHQHRHGWRNSSR